MPVFTKAPGAATCVSTGCTGSGDQVTVTVVYSFPYSIPFLPADTLSMGSKSAMIISQ